MSVRCGNHPKFQTLRSGTVVHADAVYHDSAASVRKCYDPQVETFLCGWQYEAGWSEDGERIIADCNALAWVTPRGWECEHGHEHVSMEVQFAEGWTYADGDGEAKALLAAGIDVVAMDGSAFRWGESA